MMNFPTIRSRVSGTTDDVRSAGAALSVVAASVESHDEEAALDTCGKDVIVTFNEVNDRHGVGVLLLRWFGDQPNVVSIRSEDHYEGRQAFGEAALRLSHGEAPRGDVFLQTLEALRDTHVSRVLCIPYSGNDVRIAIAVREIFAAPLCTYVMDDQNVFADNIPDSLMSELLAKSHLRLAISPAMAAVYEKKFGSAFDVMPPLAPHHRILNSVQMPSELPPHGLIIGNIWGPRWYESLRNTVRESGASLDWHANDHFRYLDGDAESLARDSIQLAPGFPFSQEQQLVERVRSAPFTVMPTSPGDEDDSHRFIAELSLPSRLPFMMATTQTPVIVLGSEQTTAAKFVRQLDIGLVCPYDRDAFREAVKRVTNANENRRLRTNALKFASDYSDQGAAEWIWSSLAAGRAIDNRFHLQR